MPEQFRSAKLRLEYWLYTEATFTGEYNGLWRNNYDLGLLIQHIPLNRFQGKERQVLLLWNRYSKRPLIDNLQQTNFIYFEYFSEKYISEFCYTYLKVA